MLQEPSTWSLRAVSADIEVQDRFTWYKTLLQQLVKHGKVGRLTRFADGSVSDVNLLQWTLQVSFTLSQLVWDWTGDWRACLAHQRPVVTRDAKRTLLEKLIRLNVQWATHISKLHIGSGIRSFWCFHGPHSLLYYFHLFSQCLPLKLKVQIEIWRDQRQNPTVHTSVLYRLWQVDCINDILNNISKH